MKFGHTLYDLISNEWRPYAVDYKGMKRVLKGKPVDDERSETRTIDTDEFFRLFEASKARISVFYGGQEKSAKDTMAGLWHQVRETADYHATSSDDSISCSDLRGTLSSLNEHLDHLIEFLDLNKTGFSKILKKFDKRVGTKLRDEKFAELMTTHMFLDGETLFKLKEEIEELEQETMKIECHADDGEEKAGDDHSGEVAVLLQWIQSNSKFFAENVPRQLAHFKPYEVVKGDMLGKGEFGLVHEVSEFAVAESCHICVLREGFDVVSPEPSSFLLPNTQDAQDSSEEKMSEQQQDTRAGFDASIPEGEHSPLTLTPSEVTDFEELESDHEDDEDVSATRGFMKDHCFRDESARYAVKFLRDDLSGEMREAAATDLAMEAKFLAALSHPNIVKMRGSGGVPGRSDFFIVLDRLYGTLDERFQVWAKHEKKAKGVFGFGKNQLKLKSLWVDRLVAAFDVARAMRHLHSKRILFRDLKPENIGFDIRGDAKIFDFGLAKELLPADQVGPDQFNATGITGTRRYMPAEVALCKPYGLSADVYSFSILLWEVLSLKTAFENYSYENHANKVILKGKRPKIPSSWPVLLKTMMQNAWSTDPSLRPPFARICDLLRSEIARLDQTSMTERSADLLERSEASMYRDHDVGIPSGV